MMGELVYGCAKMKAVACEELTCRLCALAHRPPIPLTATSLKPRCGARRLTGCIATHTRPSAAHAGGLALRSQLGIRIRLFFQTPLCSLQLPEPVPACLAHHIGKRLGVCEI